MRPVGNAATRRVGQTGKGLAAPAAQRALPRLRRARTTSGSPTDADPRSRRVDGTALNSSPRMPSRPEVAAFTTCRRGVRHPLSPNRNPLDTDPPWSLPDNPRVTHRNRRSQPATSRRHTDELGRHRNGNRARRGGRTHGHNGSNRRRHALELESARRLADARRPASRPGRPALIA
jgi:hypothetical protein